METSLICTHGAKLEFTEQADGATARVFNTEPGTRWDKQMLLNPAAIFGRPISKSPSKLKHWQLDAIVT